MPEKTPEHATVCVYTTLLFFLLLSTGAAQKLPGFRIPEYDFIQFQSFLPEDSGTLGALNQNEKELQAKWNDVLEELREDRYVDRYVANLTEAEIRVGAIYIPPQPPAPLGPWIHETQVDIIRQMGRSLRTYSVYDRKIINRVLLGMPELPWLLVIFYSYPNRSAFIPSPVKDPAFYQFYLERFGLR